MTDPAHLTILLADVAPDPPGGGGPLGLIATVIGLGILVFFIAAFWKIFTKAGRPGWASLVPFYNTVVMLQIAGRPGWWLLILWLVIPGIIATLDLAKKFGKETGFALGLLFLPFVFYPILGFGDAQYQGETPDEGAA